ncbi:GDP-L-fucose synthetase, putative [Eimeria mitis]|uniref:GDP-L-fucose synthetase, putative n=1 Tax=Eimeria mitis TaxID=44415 RepID=U6KKL8_9EIME|nr:GDP-L-fucose synthetase, putative [Eimeria mitis]CDJ35998.1 GDP-L-fucose synthetase, putative [Eimeria mitis]
MASHSSTELSAFDVMISEHPLTAANLDIVGALATTLTPPMTKLSRQPCEGAQSSKQKAKLQQKYYADTKLRAVEYAVGNKEADTVWPPIRDAAGNLTEQYEVDYIMDQHGSGADAQFLVKWPGTPEDQATWEPANHLTGCHSFAHAVAPFQKLADLASSATSSGLLKILTSLGTESYHDRIQTGLLGKALRATVEELEEQAGDLEGYHFVFVGSKDADLRVWQETEALFQKYQPSAIIHLAAKVGGLYENMRNNESFLRENVLINTNVVRAALEARVPRAIFCLSTCAYPETVPKLPLVEDLAPSHPSNEGYAAAKRLLEQQVRFSRQQLQEGNPGHSFVWICVLPCNLYGPHDNFEVNTAHVLPALVHKTEIAKRNATPLIVRGKGAALRQFLFSDDAARLLLLLLVKRHIPETHTLLNMCPDLEDSEISIGDLALIIKRCAQFDGPIEFDDTAPEGVLRKPADNSKLRTVVGSEFLFTPLEEGIQKTVDWFRENSAVART